MSELYELPNGWKWERLENLTEINIGKTPSRSKSEYFLGDKVWLSIRDLKADYISDSNEKITDQAIKDSNIKIVPKGTLLMSFKLTLGKTAFADCDLYTNEAIASLPIKDESILDKFFLKYSIAVINLEKEVDNAVKGKTLNKEKIKNLDIPLPPLSEQQRIVSKLDLLFQKIDKSIELHQKNMDETDAFMGSVLNEIYGNRIYGLEGEALKDLCELIVDCEHKTAPIQETGYPSIRTPNIGKGYLILNDVNRVSEKTYNEWTKRAIPKENDLILAREAPAGNVAVIPKDLKVCLGQRTVLIRPKKEKFNSNYLAFLLLSKDVQDELLAHSRGATVSHINMKDIRDFKIYNLLSLFEQEKVVEYIESVSEKMEKVKSIQKEKMDSLKALKASILDKAFRGEL